MIRWRRYRIAYGEPRRHGYFSMPRHYLFSDDQEAA
jgi:hypothetical protein